MAWLFGLTMFASATLLFLVQPLIGKVLLPVVGGAPVAWNTCMVFFQAALLLGYGYAHWLTTHCSPRWQVRVHLLCLLGPLLLFGLSAPLQLPNWLHSLAATSHPVGWLLLTLCVVVGLPFTVLATTAPLLQRWYAAARPGHDPYVLYATSNAGSLLGLFAYPLVLEPWLPLAHQGTLWAGGYALVVALFVLVAGVVRPNSPTTAAAPSVPLTWRQCGGWLVRAAVPASLLLGVTAFLATDLAPVPLLWVVPLALYLLSFMLAFSPRWGWLIALARRLWPILTLFLMLTLAVKATEPLSVLVPLHLLTFAVVALVCHADLAARRPAPAQLTTFYLWLALGGVVGGLLNALLAPLVFATVAEYPLVLLAALLLRPGAWAWVDVALAAVIGGSAWGLIQVADYAGVPPGPTFTAIVYAGPLIVAFTFVDRPARFALALAGLWLASTFDYRVHGRPVWVERNYFGVVRVTEEPGQFRRLIHGNTVHGQQSFGYRAADGRHLPVAYYAARGGAGRVLRTPWGADAPPARVAVAGLGTGALAYYARPGDVWTFYELDPAVVRIACAANYFAFLSECRAAHTTHIIGDARLQLQTAPAGEYHVLIVDVFSSDAISLHLLTRESLALYFAKLAPGGLVLLHISNRYLDLEPIVDRLAEAGGYSARVYDDGSVPEHEAAQGVLPSQWVVLARNDADLGALASPRSGWSKLQRRPSWPVWTDDYSNLLRVVRWRTEQ
jgi:hypothetical protein